MAQFIFVYHGGAASETPQDPQAVMAKWQAWMDAEPGAFINPGAPVGMSKTVSTGGIADNGGSNPTSGFSIVQAADIDAACKIAQACPIHDNNGTVEVAEIMEM